MLFWPRADLLEQFAPGELDLPRVRSIRSQRREKLSRPYHAAQAHKLTLLPKAEDLGVNIHRNLNDDHVTIGRASDLTQSQHDLLNDALVALMPWRKGPFRVFGHEIDAEWRSNLKWDRVREVLGQLSGRRILDVGCGNGYYMFRAAAFEPDQIIGIDPSVPFWLSFELMQRYLQLPNLQYERLGVEDLEVFNGAFDIALCMGIVYHHRSPLTILRRLLGTLRLGGFAIIESQTISGEGSMALFPEQRYAKARNVYFLPTRDCLVNWVRRSGFKNVEVISHTKVTIDEQRTTEWMAYESLRDFLDPSDDSLTIEGHPAPWRTVVRGERQFA